jgi:hypothetical protein
LNLKLLNSGLRILEMAKRYRMTPARRAALARAQKASARKRRKAAVLGGLKAVGSVAGTVALGAAIHHANNYARNPALVPKHYKAAKGYLTKGPKVDPNAPGVALRSNRKPLRYYGRGRASHICGSHTGTRIRSRVR